VGRGYKGELDELQVASAARSADWLKLAASSQGAESTLVSIGPAGEGEGGGDSGPSYIKILLDAVTIDGWIVIAILGVMFVVSVWVMIAKALFVTATAKHNGAFKAQFDALMNALRPDDDSGASAALKNAAESHRGSSLARLFEAGAKELRGRFVAYAAEGRAPKLTEQSIEAIRATVDARYVRETQTLNSKMVLLTISIAGGPFLGLLGTVVGVMITFAAIAAAGDVNVNAIAPGIAAALVATVAGLAVAIPALFGYNWLNSRISELNADNRVFIDEFITRVAENHS
jgi:biopolymer transport protein ExbB